MIKIIIIYSIIELSILIICLFLIFFMFIQFTSVKMGNIQFFLEKLTFILSLILIILIIISNNIKRIWQI
ncbi:hypothetical protein QUR94_00025 [Candidatus Karelsulcia muelleri]|nr:hypothetical protein QUR94_00025 [Candidatus Karelsulcia muelleri]